MRRRDANATVALGAALASTNIAETRAMRKGGRGGVAGMWNLQRRPVLQEAAGETVRSERCGR